MKPTILVVEDHEDVRRSLCELVAEIHPTVACLSTANGEEAVEAAAQEKPAVVLMDISLPGMNGIQATRRVMAVSPESAVVIVSIFDTAAHRADAASAGAAAYVAKAALWRDLPPVLDRLVARMGTRDGMAPSSPTSGSGEGFTGTP